MINIILINIVITLFIVYLFNKRRREHFDIDTLKAATKLGRIIFFDKGKIVIPQDLVINGNVEITKKLKVRNKTI
jgi:hypothetical protein